MDEKECICLSNIRTLTLHTSNPETWQSLQHSNTISSGTNLTMMLVLRQLAAFFPYSLGIKLDQGLAILFSAAKVLVNMFATGQ